MALDYKERTRLVNEIQEDLTSVIGASGNPEKLVKLTTNIVKGAKRLVQGVPEELSTSSTATLSVFIKSAQVIAKNPRGVDSKAIQELSNSRRAVEKTIEQLDKWHINASKRTSPVMELDQVMDAIVKPQVTQRKSSPEEPVVSDRERKLVWDLQRKRDVLLLKMEPQQAPPAVPDVGGALMTAVKGLMRGADNITAHTDKKMPSKEQLIEPMLLITEMVCSLLDVVDNLFVSKYPMRSQVYSFCTALIDNVLAYGCRSKSDDITSLRSITTQTPALLNAAKVMVEQCEKRSNSLEESRDLSIRRVQEFDEMVEVDSVRKKGTAATTGHSPTPPVPSSSSSSTHVTKTEEVNKTEYEICCNVCTSVAVDQKTQQPISKGTELCLMVLNTTTVREVKEDLATRTGLPFNNIQFNQGQAELPDSAIINPQNPLPYFLFNKFEPTEEELLVIRKDERKKNRMKIYDLEWSQVTGPVAVALYEFDTLGDDSNLAFDEGDVIEIIEKGGDGWWEGRIGDKTGSFPASFVEEISSRDEGVRLVELMKRGGGGSGAQADNEDDDSARSQMRQSSETNLPRHPKLKKKGASTPDFSQLASFSSFTSSDKHRVSGLFKKKEKKQKGSGYHNLPVFEEDAEEITESPEPPKVKSSEQKIKPHKRSLRSPKLLNTDSPKSSPSTPTSNSPVPPAESHPSPQMNYKRSSAMGGAKSGAEAPKKRPPPPRPPPFASTHPIQAAKLDKIIHSQQSIEKSEEESDKAISPNDEKNSNNNIEPFDNPITFEVKKESKTLQKNKDTNSMEDLLNNLREFDEINAEHSYATLAEVQGDQDYEVISPPPRPSSPREIVTIKISDYKPDTDDELLDDELDALERDEGEEDKSAIDGRLFVEDEQWKPREWAPSPEPEPIRKPPKLKKPSFSVDVVESRKQVSSVPLPSKPHPSISARSMSMSNNNNYKDESSTHSPAHFDSSRNIQGSPLPPPNIISRPRKSPANSPKMPTKQEGHEKTPPPVPPPRQKRPKPAGGVPPPNRPAPPPPKPKGFRSSRSDMDLRGSHPQKPTSVQHQSHLGERRWTVSQQREQLRYKLPSRPRSPVVQRKTKAVMGEESHLSMAPLYEQVFTGVGKEGILLKESSTSSITDWKSRYFQLVEDGLLYFESTESASRANRPLGELPLNRMVKVIPVGEKNQLHCFAILMKYETSIILGCHSKLELEDWLGSLNQVIELARLKDMAPSYLPSVKAAEDCLEFLLNTPITLDKTIFKLSGDFGLVKSWLQDLDEGEEIDTSMLGNAGTALCMLRSLLSEGKLGHLVPSEISKEISTQVKKSSPVRDIQSKLHHLPDESLTILQLFLKLFSKILEQTDVSKKHKLEVSDLNRMFGSSLFEGLKSNQSLTLLAYLISTHELMF